jgi:hypothetical protein
MCLFYAPMIAIVLREIQFLKKDGKSEAIKVDVPDCFDRVISLFFPEIESSSQALPASKGTHKKVDTQLSTCLYSQLMNVA